MRDADDHRPWDPTNPKLRVLLECPASSSPTLVAAAVERMGVEVRVCEGPAARGGCDLIDDGSCTLVNGADVVVNMLSADDPQDLEVLEAVTGERRPPAVVVELTRPKLERVPAARRARIEERATVVTTPVSGDELLEGITAARSAA